MNGRKSQLPVIGVTGNSGAGKGTACKILRRMGGFCIDADKLARQVMEPGRPAYTEIIDTFGAHIILPDNSIDRKTLGAIVFNDPDKRKVLEHIVHSRVIPECARLTAEAQNHTGYSFVIWDAPLLTEAGMHMHCDMVLLITALFTIKLSRILKRDNITEEQAKQRMSSQTPDGELYRKLTYDIGENLVNIIENNGSIQDLEEKLRLALQSRGLCKRVGT